MDDDKNKNTQTEDDLFANIQSQLPSISAWTYIAIWAMSDMYRRMLENPDAPRFKEILFPHTQVPLFTEAEAAKLEALWRENMGAVMSMKTGQTGGGGGIPSYEDLSKGAASLGKTMASVSVDPESFSLDKPFGQISQTFNALDETLTNFSKQYGVIAIESVAPDPKIVIPTPIPIPIMFPIRLVLPVLNTVLEMLRVASTLHPAAELVGKPITLLMSLLDLGRGNLYHAIFTFIGLWGKYPMYAGILLKILRDAYMLVSPDIRTEMHGIVYKSGKSFVSGFVIWLFAMVAPEFIRKQVVDMLDKLQEFAAKYNKEVAAQGLPDLPPIPSTRIPTIGDLYVIQEWIHHPRIICDPEIAPLIDQMRSIPPLALFFDLLNIPAGKSSEHQKICGQLNSLHK